MTNPGLVLVLSSGCLAVAGTALFLLSRHSARTSQGASLTLYSHGAFATSALLFLVSLIHVHSLWPMSIELHSVSQALVADFDCDFTLDCVATSAALIAGIVLGASVVLGQLSSRALLRECARRRVPGGEATLPGGVLPPSAELWLVRDDRPDAFACAVVRRGPRLFRVQDVVVVTTGFRDLLRPDELSVALAHEAAHVRAHDARYLPFVRSLARILFIDPILGYLARHLAARYEFGADEDAARATGRPLALARALLKIHDASRASPAGAAFLGAPRSGLVVRRIERLLDLAVQLGVEQ